METFRAGIRPAVSMGLSVTRAGGVGHNKRQKELAAKTLKLLADYRQAEEFSHFGSELAAEAKRALSTGKLIFEILTQSPSQTFSLTAQQLMFDIVLNIGDGEKLDANVLKLNATEYAAKITKDEEYDGIRDQLKAKCLIEIKGVPEKPQAEADKPAETPDKTDEKHKEAEKDKDRALAGAKQ